MTTEKKITEKQVLINIKLIDKLINEYNTPDITNERKAQVRSEFEMRDAQNRLFFNQ